MHCYFFNSGSKELDLQTLSAHLDSVLSSIETSQGTPDTGEQNNFNFIL